MADLFSKGGSPIFGGKNTGGWTVNAAGGAYIDDWVTIGVNGGIFQGTGSPTSPTTGLKIWNSSGIGLIEMWKSGTKTFYFDTNGDVTLSGTITATAGSIGGWTIGSGLLSAGSGSDAVGLAPGSYPFYAGNTTAASAPFRVSKAGALTATSGSIGGFTIGASALTAGSGSSAVGLAPGTYPFFAGNATPASAPFRVTPAGALTATSVTIQAASGAVAIDGSGLTLSATAVADFDSIPAAQLVKFYSSEQVNNVAALGAWAYSVASPYMNLAALKSYQRTAGGNVYYASTRLYANAAYLNLHEATDASGGGITANVGIATSGALYVGSSSQLNLDGLSSGHMVINQGATDDNIMELRSSDVAHGVTDWAQTSAYAAFTKVGADTGGVVLRGFTKGASAVIIDGFYATDNTTKSTSGGAPITLRGYKTSGTSVVAPGADANIVRIMAGAGVVWICDEDGDTWQNGSITAVGGFGCNSKAAQTAYALDAAISGTADGTYNATEQGLINSLVSQVNKLRAALVANGICS